MGKVDSWLRTRPTFGHPTERNKPYRQYSGGVPTPAALRSMFREMKDTLEHQVQTVEGLDDKAAQVFKFDALIIGLVSTGVSVVVSRTGLQAVIPTWMITVFATGFTAIIASALVALWAYQVTRVRIGLRAEEVVEAVDDQSLDEPMLHEEAVIAYGDGVIHNAQNIEATAFRLQIATWALWLGILLLAVATMGLLAMGGNMEVTSDANTWTAP